MERKADELSDRFLAFSASVLILVKKLGSDPYDRHIGLQLLRSATSLGANYEEARGAESKQDFTHKLQIALKEARESLFWLRVIWQGQLLPTEELMGMIEENRQICDILARSVKTLKSK